MRALRETRDALASGLTADGVDAAAAIIAAAIAKSPPDGPAPDVDDDAPTKTPTTAVAPAAVLAT